MSPKLRYHILNSITSFALKQNGRSIHIKPYKLHLRLWVRLNVFIFRTTHWATYNAFCEMHNMDHMKHVH
jgi:hypothetical protein